MTTLSMQLIDQPISSQQPQQVWSAQLHPRGSHAIAFAGSIQQEGQRIRLIDAEGLVLVTLLAIGVPTFTRTGLELHGCVVEADRSLHSLEAGTEAVLQLVPVSRV